MFRDSQSQYGGNRTLNKAEYIYTMNPPPNKVIAKYNSITCGHKDNYCSYISRGLVNLQGNLVGFYTAQCKKAFPCEVT